MVFLKKRVGKGGTVLLVISVKFMPSSEPSNVTEVGSRSGASLAEVSVRPLTRVKPATGLTVKPVFTISKFRYLFGVSSIALATPPEPGLFADLAPIGWPG